MTVALVAAMAVGVGLLVAVVVMLVRLNKKVSTGAAGTAAATTVLAASAADPSDRSSATAAGAAADGTSTPAEPTPPSLTHADTQEFGATAASGSTADAIVPFSAAAVGAGAASAMGADPYGEPASDASGAEASPSEGGAPQEQVPALVQGPKGLELTMLPAGGAAGAVMVGGKRKRFGWPMVLVTGLTCLLLGALVALSIPRIMGSASEADADDALADFRSADAGAVDNVITDPAADAAAGDPAAAEASAATGGTSAAAAVPSGSTTGGSGSGGGSAAPAPAAGGGGGGGPAPSGGGGGGPAPDPNQGVLVPTAGVYTFKASGSEHNSAGGARGVGPQVPVVVTGAGSGCWQHEWRINTKHTDRFVYCGAKDSLTQKSYRLDVDFGIAHPVNTGECQGYSLVKPGMAPGQQWNATCTGQTTGIGAALAFKVNATIRVIGKDTILGKPSWHLQTVDNYAIGTSGSSTANYTTDLWISADNGMVTKAVRKWNTVIFNGVNRTTEDATFDLTSLTPQT